MVSADSSCKLKQHFLSTSGWTRLRSRPHSGDCSENVIVDTWCCSGERLNEQNPAVCTRASESSDMQWSLNAPWESWYLIGCLEWKQTDKPVCTVSASYKGGQAKLYGSGLVVVRGCSRQQLRIKTTLKKKCRLSVNVRLDETWIETTRERKFSAGEITATHGVLTTTLASPC